MRTIRSLATCALLVTLVFSSCQKGIHSEPATEESSLSAKPPVPPAVCNSNAYVITLESKTLSAGNWQWIWSIMNPNPGNGTNGTAQDMSHWGMQFGTCFAWADVAGAAYSTDGITWVAFTPAYQVDPSQSCVVTPVLKYAAGTSGTAKTYYKLILSRNYSVDPSAPAYYKSGSRMPCCTFTFNGVGCPQEEQGCSFSQGYYFASPDPWPSATVTVAGFVYTEAEGRAIRNTSNAGGLKDSKKAFLHVAAIKLSSATVAPSASVWADVAVCENWLAGLGKLSPANLPTGNAAVATAAGNIGAWIVANHCPQ